VKRDSLQTIERRVAFSQWGRLLHQSVRERRKKDLDRSTGYVALIPRSNQRTKPQLYLTVGGPMLLEEGNKTAK